MAGGGAAPGDAVLVGPAALQTLTETYPAETARITEHTGSALRWIDETNLETVKRTAIANLGCKGYDFSGFLSDLALLCAEARLDAACAAAEAVDGGRRLENVVCSIARTYGPQKGCYLTEVNAGSSESYSETLTMGVESGEELDGIRLTGDVFKRDSITFRAAGYDAVLTDGQVVTHQAAVGIFYGAVLRVEYDRVDTRTGTASHHISYVLEKTTGRDRLLFGPGQLGDSLLYPEHFRGFCRKGKQCAGVPGCVRGRPRCAFDGTAEGGGC